MTRTLAPTAALAAALTLAALPATGQTGVETFNGNWQSQSFTVEAGTWPETEADGFAIAITGDNRAFEVEWTGIAPDEDVVVWDAFAVDFEAARRPGFFEPDDLPEVFDGEPQYWAFRGEDSLAIGRLQIDDDTGLHVVFVCYLTRTEDGIVADLVLSAAAEPVARARAELVRR